MGLTQAKKGASRRDSSVLTSSGRDQRSSSGGYSDTSGALRSDEDRESIGYLFEHSESGAQPDLLRTSSIPSCSQAYPGSQLTSFNAASPGLQTLAALKQEAIKDRQQRGKSSNVRYKTQRTSSTNERRKVSRTCRVMKEAYFRGMEWTGTFVAGPVDPKWNQYKFYCQSCKANISIHSKGAREILRHHSTEKHLRKYQRWRYEYLHKIDPYTKARIPQVRGKDGTLLTSFQLALELPKFKDVELADIGETLPFYDEYMADHMSSSAENRARIQISALGRFLSTFGHIDVLRNFWRDIGVVVNHQSLFNDVNWTKQRLPVSIPSLIVNLGRSTYQIITRP